jgi:hypothetical protein
MTAARAARIGLIVHRLRALAAGLRQGHYGGPDWLNDQLARYYDAQAADSFRRLQGFEASGGYDRTPGRWGGNK